MRHYKKQVFFIFSVLFFIFSCSHEIAILDSVGSTDTSKIVNPIIKGQHLILYASAKGNYAYAPVDGLSMATAEFLKYLKDLRMLAYW